MMRLLMVCVVLLMVAVAMPGCKKKASSNPAATFDVEEGTRPKDAPLKKAPGPPAGGFEVGGEETTEPPPDEEDSDD